MKKNSAAVALGRRGGLKGGPARAASLTPGQRSARASNAARARWAKSGKTVEPQLSPEARGRLSEAGEASNASDRTLTVLLKRLRTSIDIAEIRTLSEKIERVVFHKQFEDA